MLIACAEKEPESLRWHVIDVSGDHLSGDAYLLELPDEKFILIDTGYEAFAEPVLLPYLEKSGVKELELVVVTHAHKNHYGGLEKLAERITIKRLAFTPPDINTCAREHKGDRCNFDHALTTINSVADVADIQITITGETLYESKDGHLKLTVLHQAMSIDDPKYEKYKSASTQFTINDSSAVLRLDFNDQSILFPGDIGEVTGRYLVEVLPESLQATLLAAPHHGVTPLPDQAFFNLVKPKAIIASISLPPFVGVRGQPLRSFATDNNIPLYITGHTGSLVITLSGNDFEIAPVTQP